MAEQEEPAGSSPGQQLAYAVEMLARKNHELLAQRQGATDGESAGPVQYEDLPEAEKHQYRQLAAEVVKTAVALDIRPTRSTPEANRTSELLTAWSNRHTSRLRCKSIPS